MVEKSVIVEQGEIIGDDPIRTYARRQHLETPLIVRRRQFARGHVAHAKLRPSPGATNRVSLAGAERLTKIGRHGADHAAEFRCAVRLHDHDVVGLLELILHVWIERRAPVLM